MPDETKQDPNELVRIRAGKDGEIATATRHAFETIYRDKGFALVDHDGKAIRETASTKGGDA